jgi:hypothetical protein
MTRCAGERLFREGGDENIIQTSEEFRQRRTASSNPPVNLTYMGSV